MGELISKPPKKRITIEDLHAIGEDLALDGLRPSWWPVLRVEGNIFSVDTDEGASPYLGTDVMAIKEISATAGMGDGVAYDVEAQVATWGVPNGHFAGSRGEILIMDAPDESMAPTVLPNSRLLVDTGHVSPSPDGLFLINDGYDVTCKRLQRIPGRTPHCWRLISDNPLYQDYEVALEGSDYRILGRVVGCFSRF